MAPTAPTSGTVEPRSTAAAIRFLAAQGADLRARYRLPWSTADDELVRSLAFAEVNQRLDPALSPVALVGGASSGKSTLFNNLLGGHYASQVQIHSHTTLGPILAVHEDHRDRVKSWLFVEKLLLPTHPPVEVGIDESAAGQIGRLTVIWHSMESLRNLLLFDLPDFTSEAARREGDLTMTLLPWFDRLVVMLDSERWSDRQSLSELGRRAGQLGQPRMAVFNCTEDRSDAADPQLFERQSSLLGAEAWTYVDHRRGRGLRRLPPEPIESIFQFIRKPAVGRSGILQRRLGRTANDVLNAQEQRLHDLDQLRRLLADSSRAMIPALADCLQATMTDHERGQLRLLTRIMGTPAETQTTWSSQLRSLLWSTTAPIKEILSGRNKRTQPPSSDHRLEQGLIQFREQVHRQWRRLHGLASGSRLAGELESMDISEPLSIAAPDTTVYEPLASDRLAALDQALQSWNAKVEKECQGLSPHFYGAAGGTALGVAVVLVAVHGPLSVLTIPAAMAAISASLTKLAMVAGAGALFGKHAGRFACAMQERLLGSPELEAVHLAAAGYRDLLTRHAADCTAEILREARRYVLNENDPLLGALESVRLVGDVQ